jgi:hypothetical protein
MALKTNPDLGYSTAAIGNGIWLVTATVG